RSGTPVSRTPIRRAGPDSVLATVGRRRITVSTFLEAWRDNHPAASDDSLTPEASRRFLDLLLDRETLAEAASREQWAWSGPESAQYRATRDRLVLGAALEGALARARAHVGADLGPEALGLAARDLVIAGLGVV